MRETVKCPCGVETTIEPTSNVGEISKRSGHGVLVFGVLAADDTRPSVARVRVGDDLSIRRITILNEVALGVHDPLVRYVRDRRKAIVRRIRRAYRSLHHVLLSPSPVKNISDLQLIHFSLSSRS